MTPRPEHPKPDFRRDAWLNLNGTWHFAFDQGNVGEQARWYGRADRSLTTDAGQGSDPFTREIVVPFPWESRLSGIEDAAYLGAGWYRRAVRAPDDWASPDGRGDSPWRLHPFLCFGAVDWHARVWVDGRFVGEHAGGYTPFALDLSAHLRPGRPSTLVVRAWDVCDADTPLGKQTIRWYTHSSGIWQTVWLEGRPAAYVAAIAVTPHLDQGRATFSIHVEHTAPSPDARYRLSVASTDGSFPTVHQERRAGGSREPTTLSVYPHRPRAWSPEDPHLYDCAVSLEPMGGAPADTVHTYFGLRSISRGRWDGRPHEYVLLNGEPVYLRGALDQAFHPDGLHAYPSDDAVRGDLEAAKAMGLNMLRCHIKVNDPRYYYWADRLGVLIMYDLPCTVLSTPSAREHWERTLREAIARDRSHPSIFAWVLFNETWGLQEHDTPAGWVWVRRMLDLAKQLDPTRLVEDNSPCLYDHVQTDLNSWHFYIGDYDRARRHVERVVAETYEGSPFNYVGGRDGAGGRFRPYAGADSYRQRGEPLMNSEYGALGAREGDRDVAYGFKYLTTELRRHEKICGYVYTELTDVEWEHNGLLNYDRTRKTFGYDAFVPGMGLTDLTGADFVGFDAPPCQTLPPGSRLRIPAFVAHWDRLPLETAMLRWRVSARDRFGDERVLHEGVRPIAPRRYGVVDAGLVEAALPAGPALVTVACWIEDDGGAVRARNYVNVDVFDGQLAPRVERTERGYAVRFRPDDHVATGWGAPELGPGGTKLAGAGPGWVDYEVGLPDGADLDGIRTLGIRFEASARTARERVGWRDPAFVLPGDFPQSEERRLPSEVAVAIEGVPLGVALLPDEPADARGILSAYLSPTWEPSSYGYLTTLEAEGEQARSIAQRARRGAIRVRFEARAGERCGGFSLFGERMGAYPLAPTVFLALGDAARQPSGHRRATDRVPG